MLQPPPALHYEVCRCLLFVASSRLTAGPPSLYRSKSALPLCPPLLSPSLAVSCLPKSSPRSRMGLSTESLLEVCLDAVIGGGALMPNRLGYVTAWVYSQCQVKCDKASCRVLDNSFRDAPISQSQGDSYLSLNRVTSWVVPALFEHSIAGPCILFACNPHRYSVTVFGARPSSPLTRPRIACSLIFSCFWTASCPMGQGIPKGHRQYPPSCVHLSREAPRLLCWTDRLAALLDRHLRWLLEYSMQV